MFAPCHYSPYAQDRTVLNPDDLLDIELLTRGFRVRSPGAPPAETQLFRPSIVGHAVDPCHVCPRHMAHTEEVTQSNCRAGVAGHGAGRFWPAHRQADPAAGKPRPRSGRRQNRPVYWRRCGYRMTARSEAVGVVRAREGAPEVEQAVRRVDHRPGCPVSVRRRCTPALGQPRARVPGREPGARCRSTAVRRAPQGCG